MNLNTYLMCIVAILGISAVLSPHWTRLRDDTHKVKNVHYPLTNLNVLKAKMERILKNPKSM